MIDWKISDNNKTVWQIYIFNSNLTLKDIYNTTQDVYNECKQRKKNTFIKIANK